MRSIAMRQESEPALISANFLFPPQIPQKRISQLIFMGSMNFGSSDFLGKQHIGAISVVHKDLPKKNCQSLCLLRPQT